VPSSSQLASRGGEADLEFGRWPASDRVPFDWSAFRSHGRACRGVLYQRITRRRCSWRRTGEKFSEIIGLRHARSHVALGASESILTSRSVFQFRLVLLKNANLWCSIRMHLPDLQSACLAARTDLQSTRCRRVFARSPGSG
jgi:hypothetical protein